jgi:hypothetical protein
MNVPQAQLENKIQNYFQRLNQSLSKPETRFIRDIAIGILKSRGRYIKPNRYPLLDGT